MNFCSSYGLISLVFCLFINKHNAELFSSIESMNMLVDLSLEITKKVDSFLVQKNIHNSETTR